MKWLVLILVLGFVGCKEPLVTLPYSIDGEHFLLGDSLTNVKKIYPDLCGEDSGVNTGSGFLFSECSLFEVYLEDVPYYPKGSRPNESSRLCFQDSVLIYHNFRKTYNDSLRIKKNLKVNIIDEKFVFNLHQKEMNKVVSKEGDPFFCRIKLEKDDNENSLFEMTIYFKKYKKLIHNCAVGVDLIPDPPLTEQEILDSIRLFSEEPR